MRVYFCVLAVSLACLRAQTPDAAAPSPERVLAIVNGKPVTYGEYERVLHSLAPQMQQNAGKDRRAFLQQYALMQRLSELGEQAKLDQKSPYKDSLAVARMNVLSQAEINESYNNFPVTLEDQQAFYDKNKDRYAQVKVKVIYLPFSTAAGKGHLTEAEAKVRAGELVKQLRGGADFAALAKDNSKDEKSAANGGDFGSVSRGDNLPEEIRSAIFSLKAGEVSEPVRQPNGFWIFRAEEISMKPFNEVSPKIFTELKEARMREWLGATNKSLDVQIKDEAFFSSAPAAGGLTK